MLFGFGVKADLPGRAALVVTGNVVARAAGLLAVAILPLLAGITGAAALEPHKLAIGFREAMIIAGFTCAAGGVLAAATIRNPSDSQKLRYHILGRYHCGLDGPPLQPEPSSNPSSAAA